jgi:hypothetical protein
MLPDDEFQIVALLVSRARIKHNHPDLNLLKFDPGLYMADPGTHLSGW